MIRGSVTVGIGAGLAALVQIAAVPAGIAFLLGMAFMVAAALIINSRTPLGECRCGCDTSSDCLPHHDVDHTRLGVRDHV